MAEEEVVVVAPPPTDHKRKLGADAETDEEPQVDADVAGAESIEAKRPRIDETHLSENGSKEDKPVAEQETEETENERNLMDEKADNGDGDHDARPPLSGGVPDNAGAERTDIDGGEDRVVEEKEQALVENAKDESGEKSEGAEGTENQGSVEDSKAENGENRDAGETENQASVEVSDTDGALMATEEGTEKHTEESEEPASDTETTTRRIEVPNDKVGVLIGKGGDTIRYLQYNSGAKIQITRDADSDPRATLRPVDVIGSLSSIKKAEKLIQAVIEEADAGGSPSLVARGLPSSHTSAAADQLEMQVPNEKVGMIIGRGGDNIKSLQSRSGARIQLIPQHLPEGDGSKERTVRITGNKRQIEIAREMIVDVMNQTARPPPSHSGGYNQQQSYRSRGPTGSSHWGPRGPHSSQPMPYDHRQRGPYPSQPQQYPPSNYGGYPPQHMAPRGNFGPGWEHRPSPNMQGPPAHGGGYDYYGGPGGHNASGGHGPPHGPAPSSAPPMGPPPPQANYSYSQGHGVDYGHQAPYSHTAPPQQGYGHGGYNEPRYDSHPPPQHAYVAPQNQTGYGAQQQYGKQSPYGMPSQGPLPQAYGAPRPTQPNEMPYQAPVQSNQSYGQNVLPPQQQYPYASSGPMQQSYPPYGSAPAPDGYNQAPPASAPAYPQQATGYAQNPTGGYGSYQSSQHGYPEQQVQNNASYGYQAPQDPNYGSAPGTAYSASGGSQHGYPQAPANQTSYDQSAPLSGGYAAPPGTTTQAYTAP